MCYSIDNGERKARKEHRCDWCGSLIEQGEVYFYDVRADGADMYTFKAHIACLGFVAGVNINDDDGMGIDSNRFECALEDEFDNYAELLETRSVYDVVMLWHDRQEENKQGE